MTVYLSELLAVPGMRDAVLLAGNSDIGIERVHGRVGLPQHISPILVAELGEEVSTMLVLLNPVARFGSEFDILLRCANRACVVAVVLSSEGGKIPGAGTIALAERLGLCLILVSQPWEVSICIHEQLAVPGSVSFPLVRRTVSLALGIGSGVTEALRSFEEVLAYPLTLLDASGHTLAGPERMDSATRSILAASSRAQRTVQLPASARKVLLAAPVATGVGSRAWLASYVERDLVGQIEGVAVALEVAGIAIGHRLALARLAGERDARSRMALLDDIRAAVPTIPPELVQRAIRASWSLDAWHVGIRIQTRDYPADPVSFRRDVESAFRDQSVEMCTVEQDNGWAAWVSFDSEPTVADIRKLSSAIRRAQADLRPLLPTNVGVGSVQSGAAGLIGSLAEAEDATRLAATRPEAGYFVYIDTLEPAQLLLAGIQTDVFVPAARELLAPLNQVGAELLDTLRHYLDTGGSTAETAAILDIHRNTVANRIAQIQRALGVNLAHPETRLALHLAVRALRTG